MGRSIIIQYHQKHFENRHLLTRPLSKKPPNCTTVFIGNLPKDVDEDKISEFFGPECGGVREIRFLTAKKTSVKYAAYVTFENPSVGIDVAIGKHGQKFEGMTVRVDYAKPRKKKKKIYYTSQIWWYSHKNNFSN